MMQNTIIHEIFSKDKQHNINYHHSPILAVMPQQTNRLHVLNNIDYWLPLEHTVIDYWLPLEHTVGVTLYCQTHTQEEEKNDLPALLDTYHVWVKSLKRVLIIPADDSLLSPAADVLFF